MQKLKDYFHYVTVKKPMIAGVAILVLFLAGAGWVHGNSHSYGSASHKSFVNSCTKAGANKDYCECAFDYVQAHYTYNEARELDRQFSKGGTALTPDAKAAVDGALNACYYRYRAS